MELQRSYRGLRGDTLEQLRGVVAEINASGNSLNLDDLSPQSIRDICADIRDSGNHWELCVLAGEVFELADIHLEASDEMTDDGVSNEYGDTIERLQYVFDNLVLYMCEPYVLPTPRARELQLSITKEVNDLSEDLNYYYYRMQKKNPERTEDEQRFIEENQDEFEARFVADVNGEAAMNAAADADDAAA